MEIKNHHGHYFTDNLTDKGFAKNRRKTWNEPSYTVDTCFRINYLHPGPKPWEEKENGT